MSRASKNLGAGSPGDQLPARRGKELVRRLLVSLVRFLLDRTSRNYQPAAGPSVFVAPHPDDETLGCGALIARKRYEGFPVTVIFITDGSASHPAHPRCPPQEIAAMRAREACEALSILGVESTEIYFLNAPDGGLPKLTREVRARLVDRVAGLVASIQPAEVFLPCSPDGSSEHDAASEIVREAIGQSATAPQVWQYPIWTWWNPFLLFRRLFARGMRCHQPTEDFQLIKGRAIACYRSQIAPLPPDRSPALPPELLRVFNSDTEFFFGIRMPQGSGAASAKPAR